MDTKLNPIIPLKKEEETKKFKLIISKNIEKQIRRLCTKFPTKEWSGQLFFIEKEGNISNVESLVIEAIDLFPADLGSSTYTEYDNMDRINTNSYSHQEYMDEKNILEASIGHIHSHNAMGVFFSGTDANEIATHAKMHDYYLSLIVNNNMDCVAQICETVEIVTIKRITGRNGVVVTDEKRSDGVIKYDAIIEFEAAKPLEDILFEKALTALDKFVATKIAKPIQSYSYPNYGKVINNYASGANLYNKKKPMNNSKPAFKQKDFLDDSETFMPIKITQNSEDLALAILSGWAMDSEFNYETPLLVDIEEFIDMVGRDKVILSEFSGIRQYVESNSDKILAICKDYSIPAGDISGVIKQIEYSLDSELAPWNTDYYTYEQRGIINSCIAAIKTI